MNATQKDGNPLTALWVVTEEIVSEAVGGAPEDTNPLLEDLPLDIVLTSAKKGYVYHMRSAQGRAFAFVSSFFLAS